MPSSFCTVCRRRIPKGSRCSEHRLVAPSTRAWRGKARVRAAVIERDQGCTICGSRDLLEVHHVISAADGGPTVPENLIVLCATHHRLVEKGEIPAPPTTNPAFTGPQIALEREVPDVPV